MIKRFHPFGNLTLKIYPLLLLHSILLSGCKKDNFSIAGRTDYNCTDPLANNFNPTASQNNGSCTYNPTVIPVVRSTSLPQVFEETSGLIFFEGKLITFNDDHDTHLYLFDPANPSDYATISIPNIENVDWEEIQADEQYIYIGDIGNNASGNRQDLKIYRIEKNKLKQNPVAEVINFSYSDQVDFSPKEPNKTNFDCESFIVTKQKIYLFTKQWLNGKTSLYELDKNPGKQVAIRKGEVNVSGLITGAANLTHKNLVVLSGYTHLLSPFVYLLYDYPEERFLDGNKRKIDINMPFYQMEGIASTDGIHYYLSNEGIQASSGDISVKIKPQLHLLDLSSYLISFLGK